MKYIVMLGDGMAVLSGTELRILSGDGTAALSKPLNMRSPALAAAGDVAVAYDVGGTELWLVNAAGEELLHLQQPVKAYLLLLLVRWSARMEESLESDSDMKAFSFSSNSWSAVLGAALCTGARWGRFWW